MSGGGGSEPETLKFLPLHINIKMKHCMMLDIILKSLSVKKVVKNTTIFADSSISIRALIEKLVKNYQF